MSKRLLALLSVWLMSWLPAENTSAPSHQTPKERRALAHEVMVTLKLVQVYVTDKKGNPVLDLARDDFVLTDNGRKQVITDFEKHVLFAAEADNQPEVLEQTPTPAPRELANRKFFLFFDLAFNNAGGILKAKEAALHFLDNRLHPSDEVGVLTYSAMKGLKLHEYLTTDRQKIRKAVRRLGIEGITGKAEDLEFEYWQAVTGEKPKEASQSGWVFQGPEAAIIAAKRKESVVQILHYARSMTDLAKALRYVPGPKYILLFSSGAPHSLIYGIQSPFGIPAKYGTAESLGSSGEPLLKDIYEEMLKEWSASNCLIYPLDTEEPRRTVEGDSRMTGAFSLEKIAVVTGGKYFGNINAYERHLDKIQHLTGAYYVLGYSIPETWDGAYHKIHVEVRRSGCKVYAQKGYFNPKPFRDYTNLEKMFHLMDLALSEKPLFQTPLSLPLESLCFPAVKDANFCLVAKIPRQSVEEILRGNVELISLIFDRNDRIIEFRRDEEQTSGWEAEDLFYYTFFSLPSGSYKCRFVIRNLETGKGAVGASEAMIPERTAGAFKLYLPLFLNRDKNALYRRGPISRKAARTLANLTLNDLFLFDPAEFSPCLESAWSSGATVHAVAISSVGALAAPDVEILAHIVQNETGKTFFPEVSIASKTRRDGIMTFFLSIKIPEVEPGEYTLNLVATEKTSGSASQVRRDLKIMQAAVK